MKIVVVGGGVVGLCCAHELAQQGAEVMLIEKARCGEGSSFRNAGWIVPSLSTPLPEPGAVAQALRWMFRRDSPFQIHPRPSLALLSWCWQFWRAASKERWMAGTAALVALNSRTFELFDDLRQRGLHFEMYSAGIVFAARTANAARETRMHLDALAAAGYTGHAEVWTRQDVRAYEPALADDLAGALYVADERHVRPETLVGALAERVRACAVDVVEDAPVERLTRSAGKWSVESRGEAYTADGVVVAAGAWSSTLLRRLGVVLPLQPAKGYSVTSEGTGTAPRRGLYLTEAKIACTPFDDAVRLAGRLELAGFDLSVSRARTDGLVAKAAAYLRDWRPGRPRIEWAGLRPLAPDGLPLIGAVPGHERLYVATGHGMLGVTLAPATAAALTPLVLNRTLDPVLAPFQLDRFA